MFKFRTPRFRMLFGALGLLGAVLYAWVLTVHLTSTALTALHADGTSVVICHQGGVTSVADWDSPNPSPSSKKHCPICSGLATLHFGILSERGFAVAAGSEPTPTAVLVADVRTADRRPRQTLNRGPPIFG